jgi:hypothetical protein
MVREERRKANRSKEKKVAKSLKEKKEKRRWMLLSISFLLFGEGTRKQTEHHFHLFFSFNS